MAPRANRKPRLLRPVGLQDVRIYLRERKAETYRAEQNGPDVEATNVPGVGRVFTEDEALGAGEMATAVAEEVAIGLLVTVDGEDQMVFVTAEV